MNMKTSFTAVSFFAALLMSGATVAGGASKQFKQLDEDGNGQLSAVEASKHSELSTAWSRVDKDNSGTIDQQEFSAFETMQEEGGQQYQQEGEGSGMSQ